MPKKKKNRTHKLASLGQVVILDELKTGGVTVQCTICGEIDFADFSADPEEAFKRAEADYLARKN